jgi:ribonuclease VapC
MSKAISTHGDRHFGTHRAGLNFGDCTAYALAISEAEPLLFKGTDLGATDVQVVTV